MGTAAARWKQPAAGIPRRTAVLRSVCATTGMGIYSKLLLFAAFTLNI